MIIDRKEFHRRYHGFKEKEILDRHFEVDVLYEEIIKDAPYRNHNFMFENNVDFSTLPIQEQDGITKKYPKLKTEQERFDKIKEEMLLGNYEPIPLLIDLDYPDVIYVNNGFHRIFLAKQMGWASIKVKASYGKFILADSITFGDLKELLRMLETLFEGKSIPEIKELLESLIKKDPIVADNHSIVYGGLKEN